MLIEIGKRGGRKIFITESELQAKRKRAGVSSMQFFGRITSDYKMTELTPSDILFGPNHNSVDPKAPASWSPDSHREYMKRHG